MSALSSILIYTNIGIVKMYQWRFILISLCYSCQPPIVYLWLLTESEYEMMMNPCGAGETNQICRANDIKVYDSYFMVRYA